MQTWSDEYIEYWGQIFQVCRLHETGLDLEGFLADPKTILAQHHLTEVLETLTASAHTGWPQQYAENEAQAETAALAPSKAVLPVFLRLA